MPLSEEACYRWMVASRILAAVAGGYALISVINILLALLLPLSKAQAVEVSTMLSFAIYAGIIVWIFSVKRLRTLWLGLLVSTLLCGALAWVLMPGAGA